MKSEKLHQEKLKWGALITILTAFFGALYNTSMKLAIQDNIPTYQILFVTYLVGFLCSLGPAIKNGIKSIKTTNFKYHFIRALFGVLTYLFLALAYKKIPLLDGVLLTYTAPLFTPLVAYFWFKKPINHWMWMPLLIGFGGVALTIQPDALLFQNASLMAVVSGLCMAIAFTSILYLVKTETMLQNSFYYFLINLCFTIVPLFWQWNHLSFDQWLQLIMLGFLFLLTNTAICYAIKALPITTFMILFNLTLVFAAVFQQWIWQDLPSGYRLIGMGLVVAGGIYALLLERRNFNSLGS